MPRRGLGACLGALFALALGLTPADGAPALTVTAAIPVGNNPQGVAVDPGSHTVYVANYSDNTISVINGGTNTVTATIPVGHGPYFMAVDPGSHTVYVANTNGPSVSVINGGTNTVTATISVGDYPFSVAVDPGSHTVYVTNFDTTRVFVINGSTNTVTTSILVGNWHGGVAVDPGSHTVYVANYGDNSVSVINGSTNTVTATIPVGGPGAVAVDPGSHTVYVANPTGNTVSVINGGTNTVTATIPVGDPAGVAVDPGSHTVYVANSGDNTVSVITTAAPATITVSPTTGPTGSVVTVTGSGFAAGQQVSFRWDSNQNTQLASVGTNQSGGFSTTLHIPGSSDASLGQHVISATDSLGHTATVAYTVLAAPLVLTVSTTVPYEAVQIQGERALQITVTQNGAPVVDALVGRVDNNQTVVIGNTDAKGDVDTTYDAGADPITGSHTTTFTAQQPTVSSGSTTNTYSVATTCSVQHTLSNGEAFWMGQAILLRDAIPNFTDLSNWLPWKAASAYIGAAETLNGVRTTASSPWFPQGGDTYNMSIYRYDSDSSGVSTIYRLLVQVVRQGKVAYTGSIYSQNLADLTGLGYGVSGVSQPLPCGDSTQQALILPDGRQASGVVMGRLGSPGNLYVTDSLGRHTGADPVTGQVVHEIPDSYYTGLGTEPQVIAIFHPSTDAYQFAVVGTGTGTIHVDTGGLDATHNAVQQSTVTTVSPGQVVTQNVGGAIFVAPNLQSFNLTAGWHLLTLGVQPASTKLQDVLTSLGSSYDIVLGFDASKGGAESYFTAASMAPFNTLTDLKPLHGYWVHLTTAGTLTITGTPLPTGTTLALTPGWNLVGYGGTAPEPLATAFGHLNNAVDITLGFDPSQGGALSYFTAANMAPFNNLTTLQPNAGYWLHVSGSGQQWAGQ